MSTQVFMHNAHILSYVNTCGEFFCTLVSFLTKRLVYEKFSDLYFRYHYSYHRMNAKWLDKHVHFLCTRLFPLQLQLSQALWNILWTFKRQNECWLRGGKTRLCISKSMISLDCCDATPLHYHCTRQHKLLMMIRSWYSFYIATRRTNI